MYPVDYNSFSLSFRQVGNNLIVPGGSRVIDARGKFVIPGLSDLLCISFSSHII
jgi:dihydroorotase-like cyclic amidohydrolase